MSRTASAGDLPLRATTAWEGTREPSRNDQGPAPARPVRRRSKAASTGSPWQPTTSSRLLEEPGHRRDDEAPRRRWPERATSASGAMRCSRASRINGTEDRAVLHVALRNRAEPADPVDGKDVMPSQRRARAACATFTETVRSRRVEGPHRQADHERRQHRHRRLRPRARHGLEALALQRTAGLPRRTSSRTSTARTSPRPSRTSTPAETLFIIACKTFTTQETLTTRTRARAGSLATLGERATRCPSTSSPSPRRPRR